MKRFPGIVLLCFTMAVAVASLAQEARAGVTLHVSKLGDNTDGFLLGESVPHDPGGLVRRTR
jgi:hypothetical protein